MSQLEDFLTASEEQEVISAIQKAEKMTSGEIRVHIESNIDKPPYERVLEVFHALKLDETQAHNGVLFYVAINSKTFAIYGDRGINKIVSNDFWKSTKDIVIANFKEQKFKKGLVAGILETGKQLQKFFPVQPHDQNELPDHISKGS